MAHEAFITVNFGPERAAVVAHANRIIREYRAQGFTLTLRQLYYQFVARALITNKQSEYKRLGDIISQARRGGMVDWAAIEDRTREVTNPAAWSSPSSIIDACARQYQDDLWAGQECRVFVWVEKEALVGVIEPACQRWRLASLACRGNVSDSVLYEEGKRFARLVDDDVRPIVLHLGDHDPNGIDMTRDNSDRLAMFAGVNIEVRRIALNFDQVERYNPPPNPAKETDSRFASYAAKFGNESWELDALSPDIIDGLINDEVKSVLDVDVWDANKAQEADHKTLLTDVSNRWDDVVAFLNGGA